MLEALWTVEFSVNSQTNGSGIIVVETGHIFGGDAHYFYTGEINLNNDIVDAKITAIQYKEQADSIFNNLKRFGVELNGKIARDEILLYGYFVGTNIEVTAKMTRRAELP